ncbi:GRB2-associated-binding protein 2 [Sciurus carolinensis]|uniref:GRB2-associated-binding protein 2 n=1 Tax=Sciurus carolinensis TaxID=30640 RepID=A0AA41SW62_SCICA|nr:GRB2-associated-binding protein 2 [Sciurus carolinensis]
MVPMSACSMVKPKASLSHLSYNGTTQGLDITAVASPSTWPPRATPKAVPHAPRQTDSDDPYIFMADTKTPLLAIQIPKTSVMDKNQSTVVAAATGNKAMATPYHPHKPSHVETSPQMYLSQDPVVRKKGRTISFSVTMPWCRDSSAVDSSHHHQAFFSETCKHSLRDTEIAGPFTQSRSLGDSFHQAAESHVGHLDEVGSEDVYMPMSTLPSTLLAMEKAGGNTQIIHNPRNPGSPHFVPLSCSPSTLLSQKDLIRRRKIQPPTVDRSLKSGQKGKYTHSMFHFSTIFKLCLIYLVLDGSWSWA